MSLRMVEMIVSADAASDLDALGDDLQVLGQWRGELEGGNLLLRLLISGEQSEAVIEELQSRFQSSDAFRVMVLEVEATLPRQTEEQEKQEARRQRPDGKGDPRRLACEELVQKLADSESVTAIYLVTTVLSTVVAAIGLIRDNVAIIIGAMVIAPLLTPNMTLSLATTLGDMKMARRAAYLSASGLVLSAVLATAIGLLAPVDPEVGEIARRTGVRLSDIALALAAGSAGALAFTTGLSAALVGVMVAVALLPPLVTMGLLLGSGQIDLAIGAAMLTATNIVCINLAGVATFLARRIHPRHWWEADRAKQMVRLAGALWVGMLVLLVVLILLVRG